VFPFVQLVVPAPPLVASGRYLLRASEDTGAQARAVVVVAGEPGVARRRPFARRARRPRPRPAAPTARITVVRTEPLSLAAARRWLRTAVTDPRDEVADALVNANELLACTRQAFASPDPRDITPLSLLAVRLGFGRGERAAHGEGDVVVELRDFPAGERRRGAQRGDELLADLVAGRRPLEPAAELALLAHQQAAAGRRDVARTLLAAACAQAEREPERPHLPRAVAERCRAAAASTNSDCAQLANLARELADAIRGREAASTLRAAGHSPGARATELERPN